MSVDTREQIVHTRFYSLGEAGLLASISPADLLRLGSNGLLSLCVLVPAGRRAHTVDPASVVNWNSKAIVESYFHKAKPSKEKGAPERKDDVIALVLNWSQCQEIEDYGVSRQVQFDLAYSIANPQRSLGYAADPMQIQPMRAPYYERDGRTQVDQSRFRFALYACANPLNFIDEVGYPEPDDILVMIDTIFILGRELSRLPWPIDLDQAAFKVDFQSEPGVLVGTEADMGRANLRDNEITPSPLDSANKLSRSEPYFEERATWKSDKSPAESKSEELPETRGPIVLLRRNQVEMKIGKGRNWIYERTSKKHKRYDPTFPLPIEIGGGIGWIESEVEEWLKKQIEQGRRT